MRKKLILSFVLCGATGLATAQMMPNGSAQPTMPGQSPTGQPGRPGTMGGEIPNTVGGPTNGQSNPNAGTPVPKVDDATLERDVKQQLASDPAFAMVQVAAHNGRVELTGSVSSKDDRKKVKDMAKSVPGVTSVKEHLTIGGGTSPAGGTMGAGTNNQNTAGSISGNAQKSNADSGNMNTPAPANGPGATSQPSSPPQSTAPEANPQSTPPPSDTTPHASATTPEGSGGRLVNANYQEGGKPEQAAPAQEQSQSTGTSPNNGTQVNITMTPENADNRTLQSQIENALRNEPALSASHIQVNVTDTAVELSGAVGSSKDKLSAERIAQSFGANRKLSDKLAVTGHGHSDMAQDHPAMNNSGTGNTANQNPTQPH